MTGLPDFNRPAFKEAEDLLIFMGIHFASPRLNGDTDGSAGEAKTYGELIQLGLKQLIAGGCNHILMLDGWWKSWGATHEVLNAIACEYPVWQTERNQQNQLYILPMQNSEVLNKINWSMYLKRLGAPFMPMSSIPV